MCIIICNTAGLIPKETLSICNESNPDGMGLLYSDGNKLFTFKELTDFENFYSYYHKVRTTFPDAVIGLHFRIKTHGAVNIHNCHP